MKKFLTPLVIAIALIVTISSCKKDKTVTGDAMYGTYAGKVTNELRINFGPVNIDTVFAAPGVDATGILAASAYEDSLSLNVKLTVNGTPIDITVLAHIDTETSFTVPSTLYSYLGAVPLLVSGNGSVSGNDATVKIKIAEGDGTTDLIFGDLDFKGTK